MLNLLYSNFKYLHDIFFTLRHFSPDKKQDCANVNMVLCVNDNIISKKQLDYSLSLGGRGRGEGDLVRATVGFQPPAIPYTEYD